MIKVFSSPYLSYFLCLGWSADDFSNVVRQPSGSETIRKKFKNRGFGFVKFSSHAATARTLKVGAKPNFVLGGTLHPFVKWAEEDARVDTEELAKIEIAFIINLPSTTDENYLMLLFGLFGKVGCVQGWSHTVSVKTKPFSNLFRFIKSSNGLTSLHLRLMHISEDGYIQDCDLAAILNVLAEESSIAGLKRGFDALNNYLASHTFLVGDGVTLVEEEEAPKPKLNNPLDLLP
ncbi:putative nucleotide-binding alpha-beta plait domain superfamily, RNA-binding domain superfamily [Helianthus debilis subsp. tardiflorus]